MNWHWKTFESLSKDELYEILRCRQEVFALEQKIAYQDCDSKDQHAWHLFSQDDNNNITSYLRVIYPGHKYNEASIGRVLTMKDARGTGLGRALMKSDLEYLEKEDITIIRLSAQEYLETFYHSLGFDTVSEPYIEEGILHIEMLKE